MDPERPFQRKPLPATPTQAPAPNTAFKRKPIPVAVTPPTPISATLDLQGQPCPHCGAGATQERIGGQDVNSEAFAEEAQRRISELETEVKILTGKATAAGRFTSSCDTYCALLALVSPHCAIPFPAVSFTMSINLAFFVALRLND